MGVLIKPGQRHSLFAMINPFSGIHLDVAQDCEDKNECHQETSMKKSVSKNTSIRQFHRVAKLGYDLQNAHN
jgi:hypothetical protein